MKILHVLFVVVSLALPSLSVAAEPAPAPEKKSGPVSLGSFGLNFVEIDKGKAGLYLDTLNGELIRRGIRVTAEDDIAALVGLERQKQLFGCSDDSSSCLAELSNALGVDGIVRGSIAKVEGEYVVRLKVMAGASTASLANFSGTAEGERDLLDTLQRAAGVLADGTYRSLGRTAPEAAPAGALTAEAPSSGLRERAWIPAVGAGALLAGAGVTYALASGKRTELLEQPTLAAFEENRERLSSEGNRLQTVSAVLGVAGVASAAVAVYFFTSGPEDAAVAVTAGPGSIGVAGRF